MENLNYSSVFVQAVIDIERRMEKPPDPRVSNYRRAHIREGLQKFDVGEKIIDKLGRRLRMLLP